MPSLAFTKMNGAGNDFVVLDNRTGQFSLDRDTLARLCDRHRGVGADGVLMVEPPPAGVAADYRMRYYNADGGEAEMCGNGARCFARFASCLPGDDGPTGVVPGALSFSTPAGVIRARFEGELVSLEMSRPTDGTSLGDLPLEDGSQLTNAYFINTGVPHVVVLTDDVETVDVHPVGRAIRYHDCFAPKGTNANFIQRVSAQEIILRTYERGVEGETLACGTGATASALVLAEIQGVEGAGQVSVRVRSGDRLQIGFVRKGPFQFEQVTLGGPADFVFSGQIVL